MAHKHSRNSSTATAGRVFLPLASPPNAITQPSQPLSGTFEVVILVVVGFNDDARL